MTLTVEDVQRLGRWRATTETWVKKCVALLRRAREETTHPDVIGHLGYEAEQLLSSVLYEIDMLVEMIDPENIETCEERARDLYRALRARRLSVALQNVEGRTEAETAAFLSKAHDLGAPQ